MASLACGDHTMQDRVCVAPLWRTDGIKLATVAHGAHRERVSPSTRSATSISERQVDSERPNRLSAVLSPARD